MSTVLPREVGRSCYDPSVFLVVLLVITAVGSLALAVYMSNQNEALNQELARVRLERTLDRLELDAARARLTSE